MYPQHLWSYQDGYRLMAVHTHGYCIVLTRPPAPWTRCPTKSHYPDIEPTSIRPILKMPSSWLRSDKYKCLNNLLDSTGVQSQAFESHDLPKRETDAQLIQPSKLKRDGRSILLNSFGHPICSVVLALGILMERARPKPELVEVYGLWIWDMGDIQAH